MLAIKCLLLLHIRATREVAFCVGDFSKQKGSTLFSTLSAGWQDPSLRQPHVIAALPNALYVVLGSPLHCQKTLHYAPATAMPQPRTMIHDAIAALDHTKDLQLTAQLNAIACLARLCNAEADQAEKLGGAGGAHSKADSPTPGYQQAKLKQTFKVATASFAAAFQVSHVCTSSGSSSDCPVLVYPVGHTAR